MNVIISQQHRVSVQHFTVELKFSVTVSRRNSRIHNHLLCCSLYVHLVIIHWWWCPVSGCRTLEEPIHCLCACVCARAQLCVSIQYVCLFSLPVFTRVARSKRQNLLNWTWSFTFNYFMNEKIKYFHSKYFLHHLVLYIYFVYSTEHFLIINSKRTTCTRNQHSVDVAHSRLTLSGQAPQCYSYLLWWATSLMDTKSDPLKAQSHQRHMKRTTNYYLKCISG